MDRKVIHGGIEFKMISNIYPNDDSDTAAGKASEDSRLFVIPEGNTRKKPVATSKYSKLGKGDLHESVILGGVPRFLSYEEKNGKLVPLEHIEEETRIIKPPSLVEYSYIPYEFSNIEELDQYLEYARNQSIDSLFNNDVHEQVLAQHPVQDIDGMIRWPLLADYFNNGSYNMSWMRHVP